MSDQKSACIYYDEAEKRLNDGLPCLILKGRYHTVTGTERKCVCTGRECSFYKEANDKIGLSGISQQ